MSTRHCCKKNNVIPIPGPIGPTGPSGPNNSNFNFTGPTGSVLYFNGNNIVGDSNFLYDPEASNGLGKITISGVIDPIALQLTPTLSNPLPSVDGTLWVDLNRDLFLDNTNISGSVTLPGPTGPA
jgi:hypothetical protein